MIEILKREIDSRIYFAIKAAFKDFSIVIGNKSDIWARRDELQKGVVFFYLNRLSTHMAGMCIW